MRQHISTLTDIVREHMASRHYAGAALVAARRGQIVLEHYDGQASPDVPSAPNTLWPVASISKLFASAALMALVERGEVSVNTRVCDVLPTFRDDGKDEVRLCHLLTHTGGMIPESSEMVQRLADQTPLAALIEEMMIARLRFRPGTSVAYSDYHFLLAGHLAATALGTPFEDLVRDLVLLPMGLRDTFFPTPAAQDARIAVVRGPLADGTAGAMYNSRYARSLAHPAFGVTSSARDLVRFLSHFAPGGPRVLKEATVRAMTVNQTGFSQFGSFPGASGYEKEGPRPWGYGFALQTPATPGLFSNVASFSAFGHGGASGCEAFVDPENDIAIVVLTNTHIRSGGEQWLARLQALTNAMVTATTA
jgi:serine-type D-Ala-D-Ala carboxypeptidase